MSWYEKVIAKTFSFKHKTVSHIAISVKLKM